MPVLCVEPCTSYQYCDGLRVVVVGGHDGGIQGRLGSGKRAADALAPGHRTYVTSHAGHVSSPRACACACVCSVLSLTTYPPATLHGETSLSVLCVSAQVRRYVVAVLQWPKKEGISSP